MDSIVAYLLAHLNWHVLKEWQELVGSALGPFLAFAFSVVYTERRALREVRRRTEVILAASTNEMDITIQKIQGFTNHIQDIAQEARSIPQTETQTYYLQTVNFPFMKEIPFDSSLVMERSRSLYMHNKLLWIDNGVRETNGIMRDLKEVFENVLKRNEFLVGEKVAPPQQRDTYAQNLDALASQIRASAIPFLEQGLRHMIEAKIYNEKLRGKWSVYGWVHEGRSFKYFKNIASFKDYLKYPDFLKRIDTVIAKDVQELLARRENRDHAT